MFSKKPIKVFHRARKTRKGFLENQKKVFGEKPFPKARVLQKTFGFSGFSRNPFGV
jgi:hypothetical protein